MVDLPLFGDLTVRISDVRPFAIHGDVYFELQATRADDGTGVVLKVPQHAATAVPAAGQSVVVTFLMGQVTAVRPAS